MRWYTGHTLYDTLLLIGFAMAAMVFIFNKYGTAQYGGRFGKTGDGLKLCSKAGWVLMEIPALIFFPVFFFMGKNAMNPVPLFFLGIWMMHYTNRALITPMLMRPSAKASGSFALNVVVLGWVTLALHSYLNARYISELGTHYTADWFSDPRFFIGLAIYLFGFIGNIYSDTILRNLRSKNPSPDEPRYKIPYGFLFKWVSCPQYLCEIISFLGLAIMTWNLGATYVLAITMANLVPRALITHRWFKKNFDEYPKERKAVFPGIL